MLFHEFLASNNSNTTTGEEGDGPPILSTIPPAQLSTASGVEALVVVLVVVIVVVTVIITCVLGHSRMGPRLWSDLRNSHANPSSPSTPNSPSFSPPSPQSDHSELLHHSSSTTHSVLYVCERVTSKVDGAMAAARERSSSRYATTRSVQRDPTHGFPIQVSLPDGETTHHQYNPCLRHNGGPEQEAEMVRGYLKPPENKSLSDMECINSSRSCSMGALGIHEDWEATQSCATPALSSAHSHRSHNTTSPHSKHRHSAPLEPQNTCHSHYSTRGNVASGSSTFSLSSSSSSSMSSSSNIGGSPKGRKASFQMQFLPPFLSSTREKSTHEGGGRKPGRSGVSRGQCTPHIILRNHSSATALEDITVVPCGAADIPQIFPSELSQDDRLTLYGNLSTELGTNMEDSPPPIYSEVIGNPSLYSNDSRPERRTNSGKI